VARRLEKAMSQEVTDCLTRAARGDRAALRTLLEDFGPQVWAHVNGNISAQWRSVLDADDVMQVTYMEAFLRIDQCEARDAGAFVSWLRRIADNNLRDAIKELSRKKRPHPAHRVYADGTGDSCVTLVEVLGAGGSTPSRHVARQEAADAVHAMLKRLPPDYAKVIQLYDLQGHEIAEVAAEMGRSPGAVHMLRSRAHDRLRSLLGAETDFFTRMA